MKNIKTKNTLLLVLLFLATAIMLTVTQTPFNLSHLAWLAIVPFILACSQNAKILPLVITAYIISAAYWLGNLYWIQLVTTSGWLAFCLYTALLWPALAIGIRYCRTKKIPLFIAVPILFVGAERLQGLFLGGFFWRLLAHSQYANISLIQIADIFGAAGISFLIAMANGLLADLILDAKDKKSIFRINNFLKTAFVLAAITATIIYGKWRINQAEKFVEAGPMIVVIQSNVPQSVKESSENYDLIFADLLRQSKTAAAAAKAELIVWPETMVQASLDKRILNKLDEKYHCTTVDKILKQHAKQTDSFLLIGALGGTPKTNEDFTIDVDKKYNSVFLYQPNATQADVQYNKIHLVLFGEVVPFKKSCPAIYKLLMWFTPYDYDYSLDYGEDYTIFEMLAKNNKAYKFAAMICYEDAIPSIARKFTLNEKGQKQIDWLVNSSNDGWFVKLKDGKIFPTTELGQHMITCTFRAVENRIAIVRSVNTGISCLVDSTGQIRNGFSFGNLPKPAFERTACSGWFAENVPIDKRITFFSKHGQWLDFCCAVCAILVIIAAAKLKIKNSGKKK